MSHKKKPKAGSALPTRAVDAAVLGEQADAALRAGHHREAAELYKELIRRERRPAWTAGLAAAYAGRAEQLAAKNMLREALALWRTRAEACGVPLLDGPYVGWMLRSGQAAQALALLRGGEAMAPELQAQFAAAVLAAPPPLLAGLPPDSPLLRHRDAAQAAFAACARGDLAALDDALQAIPYRSPYRALRALLKALALLHSDPAQAAALMDRLGDAGSFEPLAAALRVCLLPGDEWVPALGRLGEAGRALVLELKGCPEPQRALVTELLRLAEAAPVPPLALFDLLLRQRRLLPDGLARSLCLRLLPRVPQRRDAFDAVLPPLSPAERESMLARAADLRQQHELALEHWLRAADLLAADPGGRRPAALVLRRLADDPRYRDEGGTPVEEVLEWLERSVDLEPADRDAQLRLVRGLRRVDRKRARERLDAARERFPDDAALLLEAVEGALEGGAYKKAAGLAKQLLRQDPLNPRVRSVIGQAHLSHARKQIDARNGKAAVRELDEAQQWLRGGGELGQVKLLRGLVAEEGEAGNALLREALAELGGPLLGAFHLLMEAARAKLDANSLLQRAGADLRATPGAAELAALAHALNAQPTKDRALRSALERLRPALQRAAGGVRFSESELTLICEALHRHAQYDLLRRFAAAALRQWPERPAFVYFEVAGRHGGSTRLLPERDLMRLEDALDRARDHGDKRCALRLLELLRSGSGEGRLLDDDEPFDLPPGPGGVQDAIEMMLAMGGEQAFLDIARKQLGKSTFNQLRAEIGGSTKQFVRALVEMLSSASSGFDDPASGPSRIVEPAPAAQPGAPKPKPATPDANQKDLFDE